MIIIDDYRRATLGDGVWDFRGTLVGRGSIDLLPWIPVNNIQGQSGDGGARREARTHRAARYKNKQGVRCRPCISHMHHQNETSTACELANATNPYSLHVRAEKKVFEIQQNTNVVADNDFSH